MEIMDSQLSKNFYQIDELKSAFPKAVAKRDSKIALFAIGELQQSLSDKEIQEFLSLHSTKETTGVTNPLSFACKLLRAKPGRVLVKYYEHGPKQGLKTINKRRMISIPSYAVDDTTARGSGENTYKALLKLCPEASEWTNSELSKSHVRSDDPFSASSSDKEADAPAPAVSSDDIIDDIIIEDVIISDDDINLDLDLAEPEPKNKIVIKKKKAPTKPARKPKATSKPSIALSKADYVKPSKIDKSSSAAAKKPERKCPYKYTRDNEVTPVDDGDCMYSDCRERTLIYRSKQPCIYQNNKFIKPIRCATYDEGELTTKMDTLIELRKLLGLHTQSYSTEMAYINKKIEKCIVTDNLSKTPFEGPKMFAARKGHPLQNVNNVILSSHGQLMSMMKFLIFRKLLNMPTKTSHILFEDNMNQWFMTIDIPITSITSNKLFIDSYAHAGILAKMLNQFKASLAAQCVKWNVILSREANAPIIEKIKKLFGIDIIIQMKTIINKLHKKSFRP